MPSPSRTWRVLAVDDQPTILKLVEACLADDGHDVRCALSAAEALAILDREPPDVILSDLEMPGIDGVELIRRIRRHPAGRLLTVIVITGQRDSARLLEALAAGANETLLKPFDQAELRIRVRNALAQKQLIDDLEDAETCLESVARAVEARDPHLGDHCDRLKRFARVFGTALGLGSDDLRALSRGAVLHDVGKIAIPDRILLAERALTAEEWRIMKTHPATGEEICRPVRTLGPALPIIRHHHERWDGSGYPDRLQGGAIPRLARIFQILDVFDALTSLRPYRKPLPWREAIETLKAEEARGWYEPGLVAKWTATIERERGVLEIVEKR